MPRQQRPFFASPGGQKRSPPPIVTRTGVGATSTLPGLTSAVQAARWSGVHKAIRSRRAGGRGSVAASDGSAQASDAPVNAACP